MHVSEHSLQWISIALAIAPILTGTIAFYVGSKYGPLSDRVAILEKIAERQRHEWNAWTMWRGESQARLEAIEQSLDRLESRKGRDRWE